MYVQYTNPAAYPPLESSSSLLQEAGWEVMFLGVSVSGTEGLTFDSRLPPASAVQMPDWANHLPAAMRYLAYIIWVLIWAVRWRPNWLYASDPPACPIGVLLSYLVGLKIVYHEHDSPAANARTRGARIRLVARRLLAQKAIVRVLPNRRRAELFSQTVSSRPPTFSVWNCPRRSDVAPPRERSVDGSLRVLYAGTIVPARLPLTVLEALARLPDTVSLLVVGYETVGHLGYREQLLTSAAKLGLGNRVQVREAMPHQHLLRLARSCDVGLALMPSTTDDWNLRSMTGASNKPFEYLASGLALVVSDLDEWREMFVAPEYGLACVAEDPDSIAAALKWLLDRPAEMRAMGERGRQRIEAAWNYETQFRPVMECLVRGARPGPHL